MWKEIEGRPWKELVGTEVVFLPVGSFEQHGPLPLFTDTLIAYSVAREVSRGNGVLLPPLFYGMSKEHKDFPLTVYLEIDTFRKIVTDILRSLQSHGVKVTVIVNGHGGNLDMLRAIVGYWNYENPMKVFILWPFECVNIEGEWHAGKAESSIVSYLIGGEFESEGKLCEYMYPYFRTRECSETGSLYEGRFRSDRRLGKELFEKMVECSREKVERFLSYLSRRDD